MFLWFRGRKRRRQSRRGGRVPADISESPFLSLSCVLCCVCVWLTAAGERRPCRKSKPVVNPGRQIRTNFFLLLVPLCITHLHLLPFNIYARRSKPSPWCRRAALTHFAAVSAVLCLKFFKPTNILNVGGWSAPRKICVVAPTGCRLSEEHRSEVTSGKVWGLRIRRWRHISGLMCSGWRKNLLGAVSASSLRGRRKRKKRRKRKGAESRCCAPPGDHVPTLITASALGHWLEDRSMWHYFSINTDHVYPNSAREEKK